jgi:hypothetical protein
VLGELTAQLQQRRRAARTSKRRLVSPLSASAILKENEREAVRWRCHAVQARLARHAGAAAAHASAAGSRRRVPCSTPLLAEQNSLGWLQTRPRRRRGAGTALRCNVRLLTAPGGAARTRRRRADDVDAGCRDLLGPAYFSSE